MAEDRLPAHIQATDPNGRFWYGQVIEQALLAGGGQQFGMMALHHCGSVVALDQFHGRNPLVARITA